MNLKKATVYERMSMYTLPLFSYFPHELIALLYLHATISRIHTNF